MRRSGINIFGRLIVLIKPLLHIMLIAVLMGVCGFLCSTLIPVCGGYALLNAAGLSEGFSLPLIFVCVLIFAVLRGIFRYAEQTSNHYIAFKLLALIRDKVFRALRRLCPAKLDGQEKGNLISILTSDIELLEVFYAHTISPIAIAVITSLVMILFIGSFHPVFGLVICAGYLTVGLVIPLCMSKAGKDIGVQYRQEFGGAEQLFSGQPAWTE
jgi:ATP-binding cassette subfamily C protein